MNIQFTKIIFIAATLVATHSSNAQKLDTAFKKQWIEIDSIITKYNLTKTVLKKVDAIYVEASKHRLPQQCIKALMYKMEYEERVNDGIIPKHITLLNAEILKQPNLAAQSILWVLLAKQYQNYYSNNRWQINERKTTTEKNKSDITTWSKHDFEIKIIGCYQQALQHTTALQKTMLEDFDVLIVYGSQKKLRPSLYDVIAHEALAYYTSNDYYYSYYDNESSSGKITNPAALAYSFNFINENFSIKDSTDKSTRALQLYQQLMQHYSKANNTDALIDVDMERIKWIYNNAAFENKDDLYITALTYICNTYATQVATRQAWYLTAKHYYDKASNYKAFEDTAHQYEYEKAISIIKQRLAINADSCEGNNNMRSLLAVIQQRSLKSKIESINIPNKPFRALIEYKNTDTLYYRIVQLSHKTALLENDDDYTSGDGTEDFWKSLEHQKYIKESYVILPQATDYQTHTTEIKIDGLPVGSYALVGSNSKGFIDSTSNIFYQPFVVSNIGYIKNSRDFFVVDRDNSQPLSNVNVIVYKRDWNSEKRKYQLNKLAAYKGDETSHFTFKNIKNNDVNSATFLFTRGSDTLLTSDIYDLYMPSKNNDERSNTEVKQANAKAHFFTDRSIYRPGQTVFFKAIVITKGKDEEESLHLANKKLFVYLRNTNNKVIDSASLVQNEFGSIAGQFKLPVNTLTGEFQLHIKDISGATYFSVEEYKRPKFFVEIEQQKAIYKLNDSITVTGFAKAFAGNNIDGAKLIYTITRHTNYPNVYYWRGRNEDSKQIAEGKAITDADGKFTIKFKAVPQKGVDKSSGAFFIYTINTSVTDISGETREASSSVSVGYKSFVLDITTLTNSKPDLDTKKYIGDFKTIGINAQNLAGVFVSTKVKVSVHTLQLPNRLIRKRLWERPDMFCLSKDEYIQNFPNDEYDNETEMVNWAEDKLVMQDTLTTIVTDSTTETEVHLEKYLTNQTQGAVYAITATATDKDGEIIETTEYVEVYKSPNDLTIYPKYNEHTEPLMEYSVGDTVNISVATSTPNVFMIELQKTISTLTGQEREQKHYLTHMVNGTTQLTKIITATDKLGLGMNYAFMMHNRFFDGGSNVYVANKNKTLKISYGTHRNKTLPGAKETYTLKVSGANGEKVAAELVTAMYDKSLDEFKYHSWDKPYNYNYRDYNSGFSGNGAEEKESTDNYKHVELDEATAEDKYSNLASNVYDLSKYHYLLRYKNYKQLLVSYKWNIGSDLRWTALYGNTDLEPPTPRGVRVDAHGRRSDIYGDGSFQSEVYTKVVSGNAMAAPATISNVAHQGIEVSNVSFAMTHSLVKPFKDSDADGVTDKFDKQLKETIPPQIRKNFNETAFFIPALYADAAGNYSFSFTMPDALTTWHWLSFAHTKDLRYGLSETSVITQKTLMVQPNAPRFLREGDAMEFSVKISNTDVKEFTGTITLELIDATNGNSVDGWFNNVFPKQYFTVAAGKSSLVKFPVQIPMNFAKPLTYRVVAIVPASPTQDYELSDGEENTLPVLTNRIQVTKTVPLYTKPNETRKKISIAKALPADEDISNGIATIEYTANPVWSVVQSLPYLMEFPHECAEQTFNRFFANALAVGIVNKHPLIKQSFDSWLKDTATLQSALQKNEELKQILLAETPWVFNAESEAQQHKNIALLFDVVKMTTSLQSTLDKIKKKQLSSGGFAWFDGGRESDYITKYIVTGIGKLLQTKQLNKDQNAELLSIAKKAITYLDAEEIRAYNNYKAYINSAAFKKLLLKDKTEAAKEETKLMMYTANIQYWYMRSFFVQIALPATLVEEQQLYVKSINKYWMNQSEYMQGMMAITMHRYYPKNNISQKIMAALKDNSIDDEEKGTVHFKQNNYCYYWHQNNFEAHTLLMEAFNDITNDKQIVDAMKTWLMLNKQTNSWNSTITTASACFALLNFGSNWLKNTQQVSIVFGGAIVESKTSKSTGSNLGYVKKQLDTKEKIELLRSKELNIIVTNTNEAASNSISEAADKNSASYGAFYYQYFDDVNNVTASGNAALSLVKKLFVEKNDGTKNILQPVNDNDEVSVGDKLIVRIELRADREMEFLHLKDMRAAATEPVNVLSSYKWQEGLGYYESTRDASTNFFIDRINKGTYIFDYPLYVTHSGTYSVGLASIQCMYAPEFTSNSAGIKIRVK